MRFGLTYVNSGPGADPEFAAAAAQLAEEAGIESLWAVEHVVVPAGYETPYPYSSSGKMPGGEDVPITDPMIWLTWAAAATTRIRLATGILILPQRSPLVLAKEAATLDVLSGGRFVLGVGIGWLREEFDALGIPFEDRAARAEEHIEALRVLWRDDEPTFRGTYSSFERAKSFPKPVRGTIPIHVGGHSDGAARRAGRLGDGFFPARATPEEFEHFASVVRSAAVEAGRDPDAIELTAGTRPDVERIKAYADLGATRVVTAALAIDVEGLKRAIGDLADNVVSKI